jgi:hypothetical protein
MINLNTGETSYMASYSSKGTGAVYKYNVTGKIAAPAPVPEPQPKEFGDPEIFTPAPDPAEPATWIMMLTGFAGIGVFVYRQRRKSAPVAE